MEIKVNDLTKILKVNTEKSKTETAGFKDKLKKAIETNASDSQDNGVAVADTANQKDTEVTEQIKEKSTTQATSDETVIDEQQTDEEEQATKKVSDDIGELNLLFQEILMSDTMSSEDKEKLNTAIKEAITEGVQKTEIAGAEVEGTKTIYDVITNIKADNYDESETQSIINQLLTITEGATEGANTDLKAPKIVDLLQKLQNADTETGNTIIDTIIKKASEAGIINAKTKETVSTESDVTKMEFLKVIKNMSAKVESGSEPKISNAGQEKTINFSNLSAAETTTGDSSEDSTASKEDKILQSIIGSDKKSGEKTIAFPNQLTTLRQTEVSAVKVETPVVSTTSMTSDIVKTVKYMTLNNLEELTVKINPQELGEVTIKLTREGNLLKASISASSKDTYSLLNSNAAEIKATLNNSQIKVQEVAISVYNDDTTFFSGAFDDQGQQYEGRNAKNNNSNSRIQDAEEAEESNGIDLLENNISVLA